MRRGTSMPSMSGRPTSRRMRSGRSRSAAARPSPPVALSPTTSKPSASSSARAAPRNPAWSSTMRTVWGTHTECPRTPWLKSPGSSPIRAGQPHHRCGMPRMSHSWPLVQLMFAMDVDALYAKHRDALLVFLVRRTADTEVALDLWAETFAQAVASRRRYRGTTEAEAAAWLYAIAKRQLALYYRRGKAEQRALQRLG